MSKSTIKIALVDEAPYWRAKISEYIEREDEQMKMVLVTGCKEEALQFITDHPSTDIVLLDLDLTRTDPDGMELIGMLGRLGPKIIALTSIIDENVIVGSFECGAVNYMNKSSMRDIITVIREAVEGNAPIHPDASSALIAKIKEEKKVQLLTPSEQEVYYLQQKGFSRNKIAETLYKSVDTVKKHMQSIRKKLNP